MIKNFLRLFGYFIAFLAAGAAAVYLVIYIVNYDKTGEVPMLVGKNIAESSELLNKRKLLIKIIDKEYHDNIPEGLISRQEVEAGKEIPVGTEVSVIVSSGQELYSMPSFEGQSLDDVKLTLENLSMKIGKVTMVHSDMVRKHRVIAQRPLPGNIKRNEVNFLVSLGPYNVSYKCPSFVNMTLEDARLLAVKLGIILVEKGKGRRVIFQKPEAGSKVKTGGSVEVKLGSGWGMWF